ncbi:MAG: MBL fold metallo-hydrolase [Brevinematia bacterium]
MKVKFWGVRGSVPTPNFQMMKVGGNTACVEVEINGTSIIFDMGTGIVPLGKKLIKLVKEGVKRDIYIVLSHTHWDHIQGFPFFEPIYVEGCNIHIYGPKKPNRALEDVMSLQMQYDFFPIKFSHIPAKVHFYEISEGFHSILPGISMIAQKHIHPGIAYGYRLIADNKSIVYCTDIEHFKNVIDNRLIEFSSGSDLLIHDAQYKDEEITFRLGWGHSTWRQAVEIAKRANVKKLALFHIDPERTDEDAFNIELMAKKEFKDSFVAKEGDVIEI